jgi:hypothetical protein
MFGLTLIDFFTRIFPRMTSDVQGKARGKGGGGGQNEEDVRKKKTWRGSA